MTEKRTATKVNKWESPVLTQADIEGRWCARCGHIERLHQGSHCDGWNGSKYSPLGEWPCRCKGFEVRP